ncbi:hypothetical protein Poly59_23800 [Rubripirellula reticaptiva]|uniref:Uncharacterized protein n=1 Tax=Rubripirellula reticaptiva TaxID=2528013 RepID=A0A5C6F7I5_9BACT|nr:hypothetical protein Poly59_23800 [Rubripirellula reticaptiva]
MTSPNRGSFRPSNLMHACREPIEPVVTISPSVPTRAQAESESIAALVPAARCVRSSSRPTRRTHLASHARLHANTAENFESAAVALKYDRLDRGVLDRPARVILLNSLAGQSCWSVLLVNAGESYPHVLVYLIRNEVHAAVESADANAAGMVAGGRDDSHCGRL